jgi:methyltransferase (TIGR00027 family)
MPVAMEKPDFTAWFVMQCTLSAMKRPEFADASNDPAIMLYETLSRAAARTRPISMLISALPYGLQYKIGQTVTNKARPRHFLFRKKEIDKQVRAALAEGVQQVIVLGAGLDVLSLKLSPSYDKIQFIEIDLHASQQFKKNALHEANMSVPANMEFVEGDLREPLPGILARSRHYKADAKTLWIGEGLFMFIPEESVRRIFTEIKAACAAGSTLLFTSLKDMQTAEGIAHLLQKIYLTKENCPFKWAADIDRVRELINSTGFKTTYQLGCDALHKSYMGSKFDGNQRFIEDIHIAET